MIKAITVDDEKHCLDTLDILLQENCTDIRVMERCISAKQAILAIEKHQPDLVFLDIEMPFMNGFELLEQFAEIPFSVIFTTSFNQYAIKAIHLSALDYLLKPIDPTDLTEAVKKIEKRKQFPSHEQLQILIDRMQEKKSGFHKIAVPTAEGFELIPYELLIRCEAEDNYTHLFLKDKRKLTACRTLKEIEEHLAEFSIFTRVHHSYVVNLNEIIKYVRRLPGDERRSNGKRIQKQERCFDPVI
jgi:two-component system, LytTR family, response regulator